MATFNRRWAEAVCQLCDPVFDAAEVGFVRQLLFDGEGDASVSALLWEADPKLFAERYPDSGVLEAYGETGPLANCIDYWIYVDAGLARARVSVEGWNLPDIEVALHGNEFDGYGLASLMARLLGLPSPQF